MKNKHSDMLAALPHLAPWFAGRVRRPPGRRYEVGSGTTWHSDSFELLRLVVGSVAYLPADPEWDKVRHQIANAVSPYPLLGRLAAHGFIDEDGVFRGYR